MGIELSVFEHICFGHLLYNARLRAGVHVREPEDAERGQREVVGPVPRQAQEPQIAVALRAGPRARHRGGGHGGRERRPSGHDRLPEPRRLAHLCQAPQVCSC